MSTVAPLCSDEDVAIRCRADFELLCAREYLASATDGAFAPDSRWTLTSASTDFGGRGVAPGNVAILKKPLATFGSAFSFFVVDHIDPGGGAVLRRLGVLAGVGQPPGPASGISAVEFTIPTLASAIQSASEDIARRPEMAALAGTADAEDLRDATVLTVLYRRYFDLARQAEVGGNDLYYAKSKSIKAELDEILGRYPYWVIR